LWAHRRRVSGSWNGKRAVDYRRIEKIPHEWGTAVNVQFHGVRQHGQRFRDRVAFTRNPGKRRPALYGEYLVDAQGEDVVAGIRPPPAPINGETRKELAGSETLATLETTMPACYKAALRKFRTP